MLWHICNKSVTFLMSLTFELLRNIENYRIFSKETIHIDVVYCNRIRFGQTKWNWFADFFLSSQNSDQRRRYNQTNTKIVADITNNTQQTKICVFSSVDRFLLLMRYEIRTKMIWACSTQQKAAAGSENADKNVYTHKSNGGRSNDSIRVL